MTAEPTIEAHWHELVTAALLGTDRRDPPHPPSVIAAVVDDTARAAPSERMLAQVAACTAVRRAAVLPGPVAPPLQPPPTDERPPCRPAAARRWRHVVVSWPVLEDEWMVTLLESGFRLAPELVPPVLARHRRDDLRRARALAAAGPLGPWIVGHLPDLASNRPAGAVDRDDLRRLPDLPIPPDLGELLAAPGARTGSLVGQGLERGELGPSHRPVLVNLLARVRPDALGDIADVLGAVDPHSPGAGIASSLADLATTRRAMLDELSPW